MTFTQLNRSRYPRAKEIHLPALVKPAPPFPRDSLILAPARTFGSVGNAP